MWLSWCGSGLVAFLCNIDVTLWFGTRLLFSCGIDCCDCLGFGTGLFFLCGIDVTVFGVVLDRLCPRRIDMTVFGAILDFHFCGVQARLSLLL